MKDKILKKFTTRFDKQIIDELYKSFLDYQNKKYAIKKFKEIEYQEGFLRDIFVKCLGYKLKTDYPDNYTISREAINEYDSKKADGIIWINGSPKAVIELKDTRTMDLTRPRCKGELDAVSQAFNYKASYKGCKYVIISNFEILRIYYDNKLEYIEFNLFTLDQEQFRRFYSLLSIEAITNDYIQEYFENLKKEEEALTEKFYKEFSDYREKLFYSLCDTHSDIDKFVILEKVQKFLDRMIFIFFSLDKGLIPIPGNTFENYIEEGIKWYSSSYECIKKLFNNINEGNDKLHINKFNGGLFAFDEIIDKKFKIGDDLIEDLKKLSRYDFDSELTVNILGHIFEQSLTDIEHLKKEIQGENYKKKNARKKFGIYYTPDYITKCFITGEFKHEYYHTVKELGIDVITDYPDKKYKRLPKKYKKVSDKLDKYKDFLEGLKIVDPACGSGAFLNMAFDILRREYRYYVEQKQLVTGVTLPDLFDINLKVLENNLYGVDINPESVEIAKLSLWLKTATADRQLSDLSSKIKQGDSLTIDFFEYFPEVKEKGGFDVVIGNPPYGAALENKIDSYLQFMKLGAKLLNKKSQALFSYIVPVSWLTSTKSYIKEIRKILLSQVFVEKLIILPFKIFKDAYVETMIFVLSNEKNNNFYQTYIYKKKTRINEININNYETISYNKISDTIPLSKVADDIVEKNIDVSFFLQKPKFMSSIGILKSKYQFSNIKRDEYWLEYWEGDVYRYHNGMTFKSYVLDSNHALLNNGSFYPNKGDRILIRRIVNRKNRIMCCVETKHYIVKKDLYSLVVPKDEDIFYILGVLNSSLVSYLILSRNPITTKNDFRQISLSDIRNIPIPKVNSSNKKIVKTISDLAKKLSNNYNEDDDKLLDIFIYHLYNISENQIELINSFLEN